MIPHIFTYNPANWETGNQELLSLFCLGNLESTPRPVQLYSVQSGRTLHVSVLSVEKKTRPGFSA